MKDAITLRVRITRVEATHVSSVATASQLSTSALARLAICQEYGICRYASAPTCPLCERTTPHVRACARHQADPR
jgi:hypothetical protein